MFALCMYYAKNREQAEDILHDGFITLYKSINQLKDDNKFEAWMRRIFVNCALASYRKKSKLEIIEESSEEHPDLFYSEIESNISSKELIELLQSLSPKYKLVFNLYAIEGYSHKEISEMLNISVGTSKSNLARARAILQKKVEEHYNIEHMCLQNIL